MSKLRINRRSMLRMGGVALGLPLLEAMLDKLPVAQAEELLGPKRFVMFGGATSTGVDSFQASGIPGTTVPLIEGASYALPPALAPLAPIKSYLSIVSGLSMMPGRPGSVNAFDGHNVNVVAQVTGKTPQQMSVGFAIPAAPSADQLLIPFLAGSTTHQAFHIRVQASRVQGNPGNGLSYKATANPNVFLNNAPNSSPQAVFQTIMGNAVGTAIEREGRALVVDRVRKRADALSSALGKSDRSRLEQHLDEVRDLQRRVNAAGPAFVGACQVPADPGADPPGAGQSSPYANENLRARLMADLLHMAMVCDSTRIATFQITTPFDSFDIGRASGAMPVGTDTHFGVHHPGAQAYLVSSWAWHMGHMGYFLEKCMNTVDPNGKNLLDSMAAIYIGEGGRSNSGSGDVSHAPQNMQVILVGKGGGLTPGSHVIATDQHPSRVILSAMRALGYQGNFGVIDNEIAGLRSI
jgi:hypothetical protein